MTRSPSLEMAHKKARDSRLKRLRTMIDEKIDNPLLAIDILMAELAEEEPQIDMWDSLHEAAKRQGVDLAGAYPKALASTRIKQMTPTSQAILFLKAANATDGDVSIGFLQKVLTVDPAHVEAFTRLERHFDKVLDPMPMLKLLASVVKNPPKPAAVIANQVQMRLLILKEPLPDDVCRQIVPLVQHNAKVLDALEAHCRQTKRFALLGALIEDVIGTEDAVHLRYKLLNIYTGEAPQPEKAMDHVEKILQLYPTDAMAFTIAEKLLAGPASSRAAAALKGARRSRFPGPMQ